MLESDRCCRRKSLKHASCLWECCSSIKSCRNLAPLELIPFLAASALALGEVVVHRTWQRERHQEPRLLLPAICRCFAKNPQKIPREIHHTPSQPLHATALLCRRKHSQPLPNLRHPAFLWICVKKSCWQPGLKGPSGWKFKPQGFLRRTSS